MDKLASLSLGTAGIYVAATCVEAYGIVTGIVVRGSLFLTTRVHSTSRNIVATTGLRSSIPASFRIGRAFGISNKCWKYPQLPHLQSRSITPV